MRGAFRILAVGAAIILLIIGVRWLAGRRAPRVAPVIVRSVETEPGPEQGSDPGPPPSEPRLLAPGEGLPDVTLVDREGRTFGLADLRGKTVVLAFLYTHCNLPSMCPLTAGKFAEARERVDREEIPGVVFLLVSFDTDRDDPDTLDAFARRFGLDRPGVVLATGSPEDVARLSGALKTFYRVTVPGEFDHNIVVSVLDREGKLTRELYGPEWRQDELLEAIQQLQGES